MDITVGSRVHLWHAPSVMGSVVRFTEHPNIVEIQWDTNYYGNAIPEALVDLRLGEAPVDSDTYVSTHNTVLTLNYGSYFRQYDVLTNVNILQAETAKIEIDNMLKLIPKRFNRGGNKFFVEVIQYVVI